MLKQLNLWPTKEEPSQTLEIWQALDHEQQGQVVIALAHLIQKIVHPEEGKETKGVNDEQ